MVFHSDFTGRSWSFLTPQGIIEIIKPTNNEHSKVSNVSYTNFEENTLQRNNRWYRWQNSNVRVMT